MAKKEQAEARKRERDGPGDRVVCYHAGLEYSPGARLCQQKKVMICGDDGKWKPTPDPNDTC